MRSALLRGFRQILFTNRRAASQRPSFSAGVSRSHSVLSNGLLNNKNTSSEGRVQVKKVPESENTDLRPRIPQNGTSCPRSLFQPAAIISVYLQPTPSPPRALIPQDGEVPCSPGSSSGCVWTCRGAINTGGRRCSAGRRLPERSPWLCSVTPVVALPALDPRRRR